MPAKVIDRLYYRTVAAGVAPSCELALDGPDSDDQERDLTSRRRQ